MWSGVIYLKQPLSVICWWGCFCYPDTGLVWCCCYLLTLSVPWNLESFRRPFCMTSTCPKRWYIDSLKAWEISKKHCQFSWLLCSWWWPNIVRFSIQNGKVSIDNWYIWGITFWILVIIAPCDGLSPTEDLNQCWFIDNLNPSNKVRRSLYQITSCSFKENAFENVICDILAILFMP